jgi:multidrug resistance efflux pump
MTAIKPPTPQTPPVAQFLFQQLVVINRLGLKAFNAKNSETLSFIILNDTIHAINYDRAILWDLEKDSPKLIGVSGHVTIAKTSQLTKKWIDLIKHINELNKPHQLTASSFADNPNIWNDLDLKPNSAIIWLPIMVREKLSSGLWLEIWKTDEKPLPSQESMQLITNFLLPAYGSAWEKFKRKFSLQKLGLNRRKITYGLLALSFLLFFIRVPLRVVAPMEVVPKDPYLITAPLDGIIKQVDVKAGRNVQKGELLFEYEKEILLEELKVSEKEVQIAQAEVNRASTLGLSDERARAELAVLTIKLQRKKIDLDLAKYKVSKLNVNSPEDGVAMLTDPDEWRGKPVKEGEKVMIVSNPAQTKIKIWVPENDNIPLNPNEQIKVFLNTTPTRSDKAILTYIANESTISDEHVPSFVAEANWVNPPQDVKLGVKGSAILYGEKVSLFYFVMRKPWASFRKFTGL